MKLSEPKLRWIVIGLCMAAAIRVFVFAAAFPFFNNVDEQAHVDLVLKYAQAKPPRSIEPFASEAALYFAVYSTPEYFVGPEQYGGQYPPPNWLLPREQLQTILDDEVPFWESRLNHESGEPPLYYALAGGWMNVGHFLGLRGLSLLYWVRFLNIGLAATLVWFGFAATRSTFPDNQFLQLGVPALLATWPQSAFYSIQGDALSPLCFGIAFLGLAKLLQSERVRIAVAIWTGLAIAAACLVKTSNLPLPLIAVAAIALKTVRGARNGSLRPRLITLGVFLLSVGLPLGNRNQIENRIARLDAKVVWRMVVASNFQLTRIHGILAGADREFLARRICLASSTNRFRHGGRVLCNFIGNCNSRDRGPPVARPNKNQRTTVYSMGSASELSLNRRVSRRLIDQF